MAVRTDQVQVNVEINGQKAGTTLKELEASARQLRRELRALPVDSQEFANKAAELGRVNGQLKEISNTVKGVDQSLRQSTQQVGFWRQALSGAASVITGLFSVQAILAAGRAVVGFFRDGFAEVKEATAIGAQLEAVIASTGAAAGLSHRELDEMAQSLRAATNIDDEDIQRSQAVLLTFTSITRENFSQAEAVILDMSVALGQDLQSSTIQVGKALQDPVKGITALQRVGVSFTADQRRLIQALVDTNDVAGAQRIILQELEREFGGVAAAVAKTEGGPWERFKLILEDIQEAVTQRIVPAFNSFVGFLIDIVQKGQPVVNVFQAIWRIFGQVWDLLKQLLASFGIFTGQVDAAGVVIKVLTALLTSVTLPLRIVLTLVREVVSAFNILVATGNGVLQAFSVVFNGLRDMAIGTFSGLKDLITGALTFDAAQVQRGLDNTRGAFSSFGAAVADAYNRGYTEVHDRQRTALQAKDEQDVEVEKNLAKRRAQEVANVETDEERKKREKEAQEAVKKRLELKQRLLDVDNQVRQADVEAMQEGLAKDKAREDLRYELQLQGIARQVTELRRLGATEQQITAESQRLQEAEYDKHVAELVRIDEKYRKDADEKAKKSAEEQKKLDKEAFKAREEHYKLLAEQQSQFFDTLLVANDNRTASLLENDKITAGERVRILEEGRQAQEVIETQRTEALKRLNQEFGLATIEQDKALSQARLENAQRTTELRLQSENLLKQSISDTFRFGIELLSEDEAARKKNAGLIKAFTIGQIIVDTEREIAGYFAHPASTASFGIAGAIRAALAVARAAFSIAKVSSAQFNKGGFTGPGIFPDPAGNRVAGIVHQGEWVSPEWMTRHPLYGQVVHQLEGIRLRGFADGGYTTTPSSGTIRSIPIGNNGQEEKLDRLIAAVENWPHVVRGVFTYQEITDLLDGGQEVTDAGKMY